MAEKVREYLSTEDRIKEKRDKLVEITENYVRTLVVPYASFFKENAMPYFLNFFLHLPSLLRSSRFMLLPPNSEIKTAATSGDKIYFNEEFLDSIVNIGENVDFSNMSPIDMKLDKKEIEFFASLHTFYGVIFHELLHEVFRHPELMKSFGIRDKIDRIIFNVATDAYINELLDQERDFVRKVIADKVKEFAGIQVLNPFVIPDFIIPAGSFVKKRKEQTEEYNSYPDEYWKSIKVMDVVDRYALKDAIPPEEFSVLDYNELEIYKLLKDNAQVKITVVIPIPYQLQNQQQNQPQQQQQSAGNSRNSQQQSQSQQQRQFSGHKQQQNTANQKNQNQNQSQEQGQNTNQAQNNNQVQGSLQSQGNYQISQPVQQGNQNQGTQRQTQGSQKQGSQKRGVQSQGNQNQSNQNQGVQRQGVQNQNNQRQGTQKQGRQNSGNQNNVQARQSCPTGQCQNNGARPQQGQSGKQGQNGQQGQSGSAVQQGQNGQQEGGQQPGQAGQGIEGGLVIRRVKIGDKEFTVVEDIGGDSSQQKESAKQGETEGQENSQQNNYSREFIKDKIKRELKEKDRGSGTIDIADKIKKLYEPTEKWKKLLENFVKEVVKNQKKQTWTRLKKGREYYANKWKILFKGEKIKRKEGVSFYFIVDTSGSMTDEEYAMAKSLVLSALTEDVVKKVVEIRHTDEITGVIYYTDKGIYKGEVKDGKLKQTNEKVKLEDLSVRWEIGGTSHKEVFDVLEKEVKKGDGVVFVTDFYSDVEENYPNYSFLKRGKAFWLITEPGGYNRGKELDGRIGQVRMLDSFVNKMKEISFKSIIDKVKRKYRKVKT